MHRRGFPGSTASEPARRLGAPVIGVHAGGGWRRTVALAAPTLVAGRNHLDFLDTYDAILANSAYTQGWVRRLWQRGSTVLHPPVTPMPQGEKAPMILSVGRFFLPGTGHNKKQLEMVEAFRRLCERGVSGWEYHLVGGCAPEHAAYLDQIRAAADRLPVVLHPDATGTELSALYGRASIFWQAGLDEDIERHPDRYEHFGIATVEAMSAGAVPVVIDAAGQIEIVEQGPRAIASARRTAWWRTPSGSSPIRACGPHCPRRPSAGPEAFGWDAFVARVGDEVARLA